MADPSVPAGSVEFAGACKTRPGCWPTSLNWLVATGRPSGSARLPVWSGLVVSSPCTLKRTITLVVVRFRGRFWPSSVIESYVAR